jgi:predicted nucleic acid-binding protein
MTYLLDSNACIGWLRQSEPKLVARLKQERPTDIVICSVVVGELIYGAERAGTAHRANNRMRVEQLRQQFGSPGGLGDANWAERLDDRRHRPGE